MELEESYQQIIDQKKISLYNLFQHILSRCATFLRSGDQIQNLENKQKKRVLYQNFLQSRQLLLRLLVILRWSQKNITKVQELRDSIVDLGVKLQAFDSSATNLYNIDAAIQGTRELVFDIPTAIDILNTGSYNRLPYCMEINPTANGAEHDLKTKTTPEALQEYISRLTDEIQIHLLREFLPLELKVVEIKNGQVLLHAHEKDEFYLVLTLSSGIPYPTVNNNLGRFWKILQLKILANEEGVAVSPLYADRLRKLIHVLQQRLFFKLSDKPLVDIYSNIHDLCVRIVIYILAKQSYQLKEKQMKGSVEVETSLDQNSDETALKIKYWPNAPDLSSIIEDAKQKSKIITSGVLAKYAAAISIFVDERKQIMIQHDPPLPNWKYNFKYSSLNLCSIVIHAMKQFSQERIHLLQKYLFKALQYDPAEQSYCIKFVEAEELSYLFVHLYENINLIISVDWKNGKYSLQYRMNDLETEIDSNTVLTTDGVSTGSYHKYLLLEAYEMVLNKDPSQIIDILMQLKKNILLYCFLRAVHLLGFESFDERISKQFVFNLENEEDREFFGPNCAYIKIPYSIGTVLTTYIVINATIKNSNELLHKVYPKCRIMLSIPLATELYFKALLYRPKLDFLSDDSAEMSAYSFLFSLLKMNTGYLCKLQLLQQISQRGYQHALQSNINSNGYDVITLSIPTLYSSIKTKLQLHVAPDAPHWWVEFVIPKDLRIIDTLGENPMARTFDSETNSIIEVSNMHYKKTETEELKLVCEYGKKAPQQIIDLVSEYTALDAISFLALQVLKSPTVSSVFSIKYLSHTMIILETIESVPVQSKFIIYWNYTAKQVQLVTQPENEMSIFLQKFLQNLPDIEEFMNVVKNIWISLNIVKGFLLKPLSNWIIFPRSISTIKLYFREKMEIILDFSSNGILHIHATQKVGEYTLKPAQVSTKDLSQLEKTVREIINEKTRNFLSYESIASKFELFGKVISRDTAKKISQFTIGNIKYAFHSHTAPLSVEVIQGDVLTDAERNFLNTMFAKVIQLSQSEVYEDSMQAAFSLIRAPTVPLKQYIAAGLEESSKSNTEGSNEETYNSFELPLVLPSNLNIPKWIKLGDYSTMFVPSSPAIRYMNKFILKDLIQSKSTNANLLVIFVRLLSYFDSSFVDIPITVDYDGQSFYMNILGAEKQLPSVIKLQEQSDTIKQFIDRLRGVEIERLASS